MTEEFYTPERALLVVAHADDIEFGMGGTAARWVDNGAEVTFCITSDGGSGSNEADSLRPELVKLRVKEQRAAAKVLGVQDVRFLGYPDGTMQPTLQLRRDLTRLIRELKPQVVMTTDPTTIIPPQNFYINHPDHRATSEATMYATFPSAGTRPIFPELLEEGLEPHNVDYFYLSFTMEPTLYVDVTAQWERKCKALLCHKSQVGEDVVGFIEGFSNEMGKKIGVEHGEAFRVVTLGRRRREKEESEGESEVEG